jgi:amino-acid N-acetyltransferase
MNNALVAFVQWIRSAAPYIHAFRGRTFVIAFGGEVVMAEAFIDLVHDLNLLNSLGIRLVLVHGARTQIEETLAQKGLQSRYVRGMRVTDRDTLNIALEASGRVRSRIEALLSMGLANSPMAGARIRITGGNYVTARPLGVVDGEDMQYTGQVRHIDAPAMQESLDLGEIVLLSPLGYSPTGEIFNLTLEELATQTAITLGAQKLIFLMETEGVADESGTLLTELSTLEAEQVLAARRDLPADVALYLPCGVRACKQGVARAHLISRHRDGAILLELFTREGVGTLIAHHGLDKLRPATIDDVGGILAIIEPLETEGVLVRRSRERLESEIERFVVAEHDGTIVGCAALYPFPTEHAGELAGLAVDPEYRREGYGEALLIEIERRAREARMVQLFVLTTRTAHWFIERGFQPSGIDALPSEKQALYNYERRSQVFVKRL